jgi:hypothetical protein
MPLTWTISHFDKMIEAQAVGTIRFPDVIAFLDAARAEGALAYRKLFDARQASGEFSESDLASYAGAASGYGSVEPLGPIALVVGPRGVPQNEALFRRLTITERPVNFFQDVEEARSWLKIQRASPQSS